MSLLCQRQPARYVVVEENQRDKDHQEDGGSRGVDNFVKYAELWTVHNVTAPCNIPNGLLGDQ